MNANRLAHYEYLLKAERTRRRATLERIAAGAPAWSEESAGPGDDADAGIAGVAPEDDDAVIARELAALREIETALQLIESSPHDYGICAQCRRPIPPERLELFPATRICGRGAALAGAAP